MQILPMTPRQVRYLRSIGVGTPHGNGFAHEPRPSREVSAVRRTFWRFVQSSRRLLRAMGLITVLSTLGGGSALASEEPPFVNQLAAPESTPVPLAEPIAPPSTVTAAPVPESREKAPAPSAPRPAAAARPSAPKAAVTTTVSPIATPTPAKAPSPQGARGPALPGLPGAVSRLPGTPASSPAPSTVFLGVPSAANQPRPSQDWRSRLERSFSAGLLGSLCFLIGVAFSLSTISDLHRAVERSKRRDVARLRRSATSTSSSAKGSAPPDFRACAGIADATEVFLGHAATSSFLVPADRPSASWGVGLSSHQGHVRGENQDFGLAFRAGDCQVVCIADGLGGISGGRDASRIAVAAAAWSVLATLQDRAAAGLPSLVSEKALLDAAAALALAGISEHTGGAARGLRTTLLVLTATPAAFGLAYVGDGGGLVVHSTGTIDTLLHPQKANGLAHVVAASLGPVLEGEPQVVLAERKEGDVVLLGTDGVFDRTLPSFPKSVLRALVEGRGDAQAVATRVVGDLAEASDSSGYICDDNLTIGIVGPGSAPALAPGFWSTEYAEEQKPC